MTKIERIESEIRALTDTERAELRNSRGSRRRHVDRRLKHRASPDFWKCFQALRSGTRQEEFQTPKRESHSPFASFQEHRRFRFGSSGYGPPCPRRVYPTGSYGFGSEVTQIMTALLELWNQRDRCESATESADSLITTIVRRRECSFWTLRAEIVPVERRCIPSPEVVDARLNLPLGAHFEVQCVLMIQKGKRWRLRTPFVLRLKRQVGSDRNFKGNVEVMPGLLRKKPDLGRFVPLSEYFCPTRATILVP